MHKCEKDELREINYEAVNSNVPSFFSQGVDHTLKTLPTRIEHMKKDRKRRYRKYAITAAVLASVLMVGSFNRHSIAMADAIKKWPILNYIFDVKVTNISTEKVDPHSTKGSQFTFGNNKPIVRKSVHFPEYNKSFYNYIGTQIPKLKDPFKVHGINVIAYQGSTHDGKDYEITAKATKNQDMISLHILTNATNQPRFEGQSVNPDVMSNAKINGIDADMITYQYSNQNDKTNYIAWKRNQFSIIISSTLSKEELIKIAKDIDFQAQNIKD